MYVIKIPIGSEKSLSLAHRKITNNNSNNDSNNRNKRNAQALSYSTQSFLYSLPWIFIHPSMRTPLSWAKPEPECWAIPTQAKKRGECARLRDYEGYDAGKDCPKRV